MSELLEVGSGGGSAGAAAAAAGGAGAAQDKQRPIEARKAVPVQKLAYSHLQTNSLKQSYQMTVNANNLVHHAHSLLGLVARLKLAHLLANSALDRTRQQAEELDATTAGIDGIAAAEEPLHPLEIGVPHPSTIPAHMMPAHLLRTQQQLHHTGLDLYAKISELDRQVEKLQWERQKEEKGSAQTEEKQASPMQP
jgi:hypothetical protein